MPNVQPVGQSGSAPQPTAQSGMPPISQPTIGYTPTGQPMVQQVVAAPGEPKRDLAGLIKTIAIVALSLVAVTFVGLFVWMTTQYNSARTDVDGQIATAVRNAVDEKATQLEMEFAEREKYPYYDFVGPEDYGALSFKYPKTWSVFVEADAVNGGDYHAYLNPKEVQPLGNNTINALRVSILNKSFDEVVADYQKQMEWRDINLSVESVTIGEAGIPANRYTGTIPESELSGYIVVFKIRDKTAILQTDSTTFADDFNTLISTVKFNA